MTFIDRRMAPTMTDAMQAGGWIALAVGEVIQALFEAVLPWEAVA